MAVATKYNPTEFRVDTLIQKSKRVIYEEEILQCSEQNHFLQSCYILPPRQTYEFTRNLTKILSIFLKFENNITSVSY